MKTKKILKDLCDTLIPLLIMLCIIYLNFKGKAIGKEYVENAQQALFVQTEGRAFSDKELESILVENIRIQTKKIEMYDDKLDPMFQISFSGSSMIPSLDNFPRLKDLVRNEKTRSGRGQASITVNGALQSAYYEWIINSENEQRLVIVYSSLNEFKDYRFIDFIAYTGVALTILIVVKERHEKIAMKNAQINNVEKAIAMIDNI